MKRKLTIIILSISLFIVLGGTFVYAWWSKTTNTKSISATTTGIVFSYKINEDDIIDEKYSVSDLAFFGQNEDKSIDMDNYLLSMACRISINITDICKSDLDVEVSITPTKEENETAYVTGFITTQEVSTIPTTLDETINFSITQNETLDSTSTVYLYMYGIQTDANATNDFLDKSYTMTLKIVATRKTS